MMSRGYDVVVERDEDGCFVASVPALRGCHTQAGSLEQLMERVDEAIELCSEYSSRRSAFVKCDRS
jgi:predicted RNase H-like HicB family nuclease